MKKQYSLTIRFGNGVIKSTAWENKRGDVEKAARDLFKANSQVAAVGIVSRNYLNRYKSGLVASIDNEEPLRYIKPGYYNKGWAHAAVNHLSDYRKAAEEMGIRLVNFGNDSKSGSASYGAYCYVEVVDGLAYIEAIGIRLEEFIEKGNEPQNKTPR